MHLKNVTVDGAASPPIPTIQVSLSAFPHVGQITFTVGRVLSKDSSFLSITTISRGRPWRMLSFALSFCFSSFLNPHFRQLSEGAPLLDISRSDPHCGQKFTCAHIFWLFWVL